VHCLEALSIRSQHARTRTITSSFVQFSHTLIRIRHTLECNAPRMLAKTRTEMLGGPETNVRGHSRLGQATNANASPPRNGLIAHPLFALVSPWMCLSPPFSPHSSPHSPAFSSAALFSSSSPPPLPPKSIHKHPTIVIPSAKASNHALYAPLELRIRQGRTSRGSGYFQTLIDREIAQPSRLRFSPA